MGDPTIASKVPAKIELEPGTYYWCRCGLSKKQPFCDGAHTETEFMPMEFTLEEKKWVALCQCKRTGKEPDCDGTHRGL